MKTTAFPVCQRGLVKDLEGVLAIFVFIGSACNNSGFKNGGQQLQDTRSKGKASQQVSEASVATDSSTSQSKVNSDLEVAKTVDEAAVAADSK